MVPLKKAEKKVGLLLRLCCLSEANMRMREHERSTPFWMTLGFGGLQNASTAPYIGDAWITFLAAAVAQDTRFQSRIRGCCYPAPRRDCEADCTARSSVAARIAVR